MQTVTENMLQDFERHPIGTGAELARLNDRVRELADALLSMLNLEGAAVAGSDLGAWQGLDVAYHTDKARKALRAAGIS